MDVFFEPQRCRPFSIEVGYFDTVLEIKEKIEKYQRIPVSKQTLIFNGRVLRDDKDIEQCEILHNSRIQLFVSSDQAADENGVHVSNNRNHCNQDYHVVKIEQSPPSDNIPLSINVPSASKSQALFVTDTDDHVLNLKDNPNEIEQSVLVNGMVIQLNGQDFPVGSGGTGNPVKLRLMVLPKCGNRKIPVEVNASDKVSELRKELARLHQRLQFSLPNEGYFFIYKQNVMDDDRSFRWHHVGQGDTIEIFNGSVTGGS